MTSKLSWIAFLPLTLAAIALKIYQTVFMLEDDTLFGLNQLALDYVALGFVALILVLSLIFCLVDRKIARYYIPKRNIAAGIFGMILALTFAGDGASKVFKMVENGTFEVLDIIEVVLLILTAVVFIVLSLSHFVANFDSKRFTIFYLIPAVFFALRMVRVFIDFTTISIIQADVTLMICYVLATLFFFNFAVLLSVAKAKNTVKACLIYGFPAAAVMLSYGIAGETNVFLYAESSYIDAQAIELALMGIYIITFLVELTFKVDAADQVEILEEYDEYDEKASKEEPALDKDEMFKEGDTVVVTGLKKEGDDDDTPSSYLTTADTSDYIYQANTVEEEEKRNEDYISNKNKEDIEGYITGDEPEEEEVEEEQSDASQANAYESRMDEIDRLILEISSEE